MSEYKFECWIPANGETFEDRSPIAAYDHESAAMSYIERCNDDGECEEWDVFVVEDGEAEDSAKMFSVIARMTIEYDAVELTPVTCEGCSGKFGRTRRSVEVECQRCKSKRAYEEHRERMKQKSSKPEDAFKLGLEPCEETCADDRDSKWPCQLPVGHDGSHRDSGGRTWARPHR